MRTPAAILSTSGELFCLSLRVRFQLTWILITLDQHRLAHGLPGMDVSEEFEKVLL